MRYLLVILLAGCATQKVEMQELVDAWVGHDFEEIVKYWGPPTFDAEATGGVWSYTWRHTASWSAPNRSPSAPSVDVSGGTGYGMPDYRRGGSGNSSQFWCDKIFTVDQYGVITSGSIRGNACE